MNSACSKAAASAAGVRAAAALGSRGVFLYQRQCIFVKWSPSPLSARSSLPDPIATRPSHRNNRQPSLFVAQCSGQEPPAYVLLKTTDCADGSILFNFGQSEEDSLNDPWFPSGSANGSARIHKDSNDSTADEEYAQELNSEENKQNSEERILDGSWNNQDVILNSAACIIPHLDKVKKGGEDAYFIDGTRWVGVADGVPGNYLYAGNFARELMENCAKRAHQVRDSSDPKSVLIYAVKRTKAKGLAATLIASLYDRTLQVANIGNSGFVVVRGSTVVARSKPMIRGINFPYQIGTGGDDPEMAEVYAVRVQKNDVVILGSNGIWDNLFEKQVIEIVNSVQMAGGEPGAIAHQLVLMASKVGREREGTSPFAEAVHAAGYTDYLGGKLDDATAVVSFVT